MKEPLLSPLQKRIVSIAITFAALFAIVTFISLTLTNLGQTLHHFSKVIWPLVIAAILGFVLRPLIKYSEKHLKLSPTLSILLIYFILLIVITTFLFFTIPILVEQSITLIKSIPKLYANIFAYFEFKFPTIAEGLKEKISHLALFKDPNLLLETFYAYVPKVLEVGVNIISFFAWVTALAVIPIYLFYILSKKSSFIERIEEELSFMKPSWRDDVIFLINQYIQILEAFFRGQLLIALIMAALYAIGLSLIGLQFALLLGFFIGLLNVVPYLGIIIGLITVIPIAFFQENGSWILALMATGVFVGVQNIEGYFLTPKIMGKRTGLHPMVIIISLFFWGIAFDSILGMILAIPLTASLMVTWYLVKRKYLSPLCHTKPKPDSAQT